MDSKSANYDNSPNFLCHLPDKVDMCILLAICHPSGCTVVSCIVIIVVVCGVCNRSQMRTSKCTCLIFGVSIGLDAG